MRRLRVGANLLWLVPGVVGGSEESTVSALTALRDHSPGGLELHLFVLEPFAAAYPDLVASLPTDVLPMSGRPRVARIAAESSWLARRTRRFDLVHHWGGTMPVVRSAPGVLTVHDLQPLERRATHGWVKRAYLAAAVPPSARTARLVITPSEYVRRSVIARTGVAPERVVAVPHTVVHRPEPSARDRVVERYGIDGPVVLYPAITYPHKNHVVLVEAFARVLARHPDALLVLTGRADSAEREVRAAVERLGISGRVRRTGRVPGADLTALLDLAAVLAWPSSYEGFGVPVAEAMSRGVPVVAARATALPELVGDAGILVDPHDPRAWSEALVGLLGDPDRRAALAAGGIERARRWAPDVVAGSLADAYRKAVAPDRR